MEDKRRMEFYGGIFGAVVPFIAMVVVMVILTLTKNNGMKCFWVAGVTALMVTFLLAKDKKQVNDVAIESLKDNMFATTTIIFLLAGILSYLLRDSGLIYGLLWVCQSLNVNAKFLPLVTFLICVVISTACGTQGGTVSAATPILFPLAVSLGCNPALMLGSIISGSMFGDNLAPISDTTIASSGSLHSNVRDVVKSRIKYSVMAAAVAAVLFIIFGASTTQAVANAPTADASQAKTLIMLVIPVVMIIMMFRGSELIPVLLVCDLLAFLIDVVFGFVPLSKMIMSDGPIVRGMDGMIGVIVFCLLMFILNGFIKESGLFDVLLDKLSGVSKTPRQVELISMLIIAFTTVIVAGGTSAIVVSGPIVYQLFKKANIDRRRGANYLDGTACGVASLLPWNPSLLIMFGLAAATELLPETFGPQNIIPFNFHGLMLIVVYLFCAITGLFRTQDATNYED